MPTNEYANNIKTKIIIEHLYTVEDYLTFNISVKAGVFQGASPFCIPKTQIMHIIREMKDMKEELKGEIEVNDADSDSFIAIQMKPFGHACIWGQIGGSHERNCMKFSYDTDQTVLTEIIQRFKDSLICS